MHFAKGNVGVAERFVTAAWRLAHHPEVGDHLAQLYQQQGRRDEAIKTYALALTVKPPDERTRARLAELVGDDHVAGIVTKFENDLAVQRTITFKATGPTGVNADFFVLFNHDGSVESVKFITGDDRLRSLADDVRAAKYTLAFPDETPTKLLRRGTVTCPSAGECRVLMLLPADAQAIQPH